MKRILCSIVVLSCFVCPAVAGGQSAAANPADVTVTVTVFNRRPNATSVPRISKDDVVVRQSGDVRSVLAWQPLAGSAAGIDLAVLVDDSLESGVTLQWQDVANFIRLLPKESRVAIAYGTQSRATMAQPFTSDRERAIKALRIPHGRINEGASIYLSLVDLIHRWPGDGRPRMVLLISEGVDLFYGVLESQPGVNVNLQRAVDDSLKNGVMVDSIFASSASHVGHNLFLINNGQSCLARLAVATGGTAYTNGLETPVSFSPYLKEINESFANMYRLTFRAALPAKSGFARIQLTAEPEGIELVGPARVYLPAAH